MLMWICKTIFKFQGWKFVNNAPNDLKSFVFVGAPHTSNYDFIPAMAMAYYMKKNCKFIIKNEWLKFPLGILLRSLGAIGVDRKQIQQQGSSNTTELIAALFKKYEDLVLMIAPEGTRSSNAHWKTGFYYTAVKAGVPIVVGFADYAKKEAGIGVVIYPTNFEVDMKKITEFYRPITAKNPENFKLDERFA
jgi:1-acyl-sn-glycerol-3-phosphate acyltransferase